MPILVSHPEHPDARQCLLLPTKQCCTAIYEPVPLVLPHENCSSSSKAMPEVHMCITAGDVQLLKQLGDCHLQASHWQPALIAYQHALALAHDQQQQQQQQEALQAHAADGPRSQSQPQQLQDAGQPASVLDLILQSCCAAVIYPQGGAHAEAAVHLVQSVMQQQAGNKLPEALKLYIQVMWLVDMHSNCSRMHG
jgi:hypothetical protein